MTKYMEVKDIMTQAVITVHPSDQMEKVADIFETHHFHHLPVVDDDRKVVGMISLHDYYKVLNAFTIFSTANSRAANQVTLRALLTRDVMTKQLATIHEDEQVEKAVGMFLENMFHALPVVNDNKELVGILTTFDLLNHAFR